MAIATQSPTHSKPVGKAHAPTHTAPVTPGKVAMWLFLATEVMFFTGLIGSYIVLRAGSPHAAYSNLYPPNTPIQGLENTEGLLISSLGGNESQVEEILHSAAGQTPEEAKELAEEVVHNGHAIVAGLTHAKAETLKERLDQAGAVTKIEPFQTHSWPLPYDDLTNPLAINLTAGNTFVLICSSVTMVLALSAIQRGKRAKFLFFLGATVLIGSTFLSVQVYEYYQLMFGHHYPPGISATTHFRPSVSLFASCFFTMTGFHGAHVTGGVILLACIFIRAVMGGYSPTHYAPVEMAGLYWHFVDLVWIILFTIVYLI
ncbi:MAG: cytochrome c oxidase subunit 3 [Isosphaeraceae bacterium]